MWPHGPHMAVHGIHVAPAGAAVAVAAGLHLKQRPLSYFVVCAVLARISGSL
jgi:hypothetical protein